MKLLILVIIILGMIFISQPMVVLAGLSSPTYPQPFTQTVQTTPSSISQVSAKTFINIQNMQFTPGDQTILAGSTVIWVNQDSVTHTSTADHPNLAENWDSGNLSPGQSFSQTFTQVGVYTYHCNIHPTMHGIIRVIPATQTSQTQMTQQPITTPVPTTSPTSTVTYSTANQLPKTGPDLPVLALNSLLPIGWLLSRFNRGKKSSSLVNLWQERQFKLS